MESKYVALVAARLSLGFIFIWAFLDKLLGLSYSTCAVRDACGDRTGVDALFCAKAWIYDGNPTKGFLGGISPDLNPFASFFNAIAGHPVTNWLFMLGLLGIGVALIFGAGLRIAAWSGGIMLVAMWVAEWGTFTTNPFMDDHLVYTTLLFVLAGFSAGDYFGLGKWWKSTSLVKKYSWLA